MKKNVLILIGMVLAIGGCGQPVSTEPAVEGNPTSVSTAKGTPVEVSIKEWSISLVPASIPAGIVTLKMRNDGAESHGIYIDGPGVQRKASLLPPGKKAELTIDIPAGDFNLVDFVKDNETAHNMTTVLSAR